MSISDQSTEPHDDSDLEQQLEGDYPQSWIPENEGDAIYGTVVRWATGWTQYGEAPVLVLETDHGLRSVWVLSTVLKNQLGRLKPQAGERIGIKYGAERTSAGGNRYRDYRVAVDRGATTPDFDSWAQELPEEGE